MNRNRRILVVDDNPIERENLEDLLLPLGYVLAFASNGAQGLMKATEFDPDLILLDVMMPEMDGFEVCRRLRADPATAELPIILLTALNDRASRLHGIENGADDFISKPFDSVELRARVHAITRLNRYRRLQAERAKFERVVEHAETGYLLLDEQGRIHFANPTSCLYLSLPEHNSLLVNESFLTLAKKQYQLEPRKAWDAWPDPAPDEMIRYLVRPETATALAMWIRVDILDHLSTRPESTNIVSLRDVTEQMVSQRDRRKFHTVVTHKLRTPFISILAGLELLIKHNKELSRDEIAELSGDAYKWAKRLYDEIEEIIRYIDSPLLAERESGLHLLQLPVIVTNVCAGLGLQKVSISSSEEMAGVRVSLSRTAIELIMWEILGNAKKFHPRQNPTIDVSAVYENAGEVTIQVSDDGLSLSPEQLAHIWTPYYQGEKHFTGNVEGMGLGLSLVASLVWSAGGRCRIFNRVGRPGLTVDLSLPCQMSNGDRKNS
jgi:DNA-binding response OmpR family regulator